MSFRERQREPEEGPRQGADPGDEHSDANRHLGRVRREGEDILGAGAEAIRRALSEDSEAFLQAVTQEGGQ